MKKQVMTALVLMSCGVLSALPVGNPTEASLYTQGFWCKKSTTDSCDSCFNWCDAVSLRVGFYGDYVFNRNIELNSSYSDSDLNKFEMYTNAGYLALNFCNRVDIFSSLGATTLSAFGNTAGFVFEGGPYERGIIQMQWNPAFSWSIGARATLWECRGWGLGVEGQYFQTSTSLDYVLDFISIDNTNYQYFNDNNSATYGEWQVGVGMSYELPLNCSSTAFIPYMGLKWAGATITHDSTKFLSNNQPSYVPELVSKKLWGYCVGISVTQNETFGLTIEGRFADERAAYVNGQMRF